jgi:hypothetical protein
VFSLLVIRLSSVFTHHLQDLACLLDLHVVSLCEGDFLLLDVAVQLRATTPPDEQSHARSHRDAAEKDDQDRS